LESRPRGEKGRDVTRAGFTQLQDVLMDADFPDLDLALRRGRHIDRDDAASYELLAQAQEHLESFYRRYGCELIYKTDGYYYLLPTGEKLSRRQLAPADMLVGQALALLYLDPAAIERGGRVTMEELIEQLVTVLGSDALVRAFNPKRKRYDERIAQKTARAGVAKAVRHLGTLGFVEMSEEAGTPRSGVMLGGVHIRLRPALLRFAEPVRGLSEPAEALAKLVARGEVLLESEAEHTGGSDDAEPESSEESDLQDTAEAHSEEAAGEQDFEPE
jgi:chromosome partition protein MukE